MFNLPERKEEVKHRSGSLSVVAMASKDCVVRASVWLLAVASGFLFFDQASSLMDSVPGGSPADYPPGTWIAVDLGNTNSCVAGYGQGKIETMFQFCIPSWVAFTDDGAVLVGEDAKNHAAVNPEAAIFGFKRILGRRWNHTWDTEVVQRVVKAAPYKLVEKNIWPYMQVKTKDGVTMEFDMERITAMVLAKLKETAEAHLGYRIQNAIYTIPQQYHREAPRAAARHVGNIAGLYHTMMLYEPIAAAIAYGLHRRLRDEGNVLVLHIGGGTSEASVLALENGGGVFEFLGAHHDPFFGGDDFDQRAMDHYVKLIREKHGKDISNDKGALRKLRTACEHAKKVLSSQHHAQLNIESLVDGVDFSELLTRAQFEELNRDLFPKAVALVERAMEIAELGTNNKDLVDEIVLIGGSTMIPKIQQVIREYFHGKEPNTGLKPDEVVAYGAALLTRPTDWCYGS